MALLYRFSKLNDRYDTGVFTFIVTRSVTRDLHRDATTKDFYYGFHRWAISFSRANDKVLGVYLIIRDPSPSTICEVDYSITLLNREHYSRNEVFSEKQCKFTTDSPAHGINKWIPLADIQTRNFGDETSEFLLELSLGNVSTVFDATLTLGSGPGPNGGITSTSGNHSVVNHHHQPVTFKNGKIETSYFHFGGFEWNLTIVSHNANSSGAASIVRSIFKDKDDKEDFLHRSPDAVSGNRFYIVYLNRLTGFENPCKVQYRLVLGAGHFKEDSGLLEIMSDVNGRSRGYQIDHHTFNNIVSVGALKIFFEFTSCNPISEAKVSVQRSISPTINAYDRNKQGWAVEADLESDFLKLKLYFMDLHSVPRNHLRYVSWYTYLCSQDPATGVKETLAAKASPHFNYYLQDGIDMGVVMDTNVSVADIKANPKKYLEAETFLTVQIEWFDSILLFNHIYHKYDDIARTHCHQMRREIAALTSENYSLERQIFAYQRSMSMANNIARMSLASSPSRAGPPTIGLTASPIGDSGGNSGYYSSSNVEASGSGGYGRYSDRESQSPQQHQQQPAAQYLSQVQQQYFNTFALAGKGSASNPGSARTSFSGPASPHHSNQYHHQPQATSPYSSGPSAANYLGSSISQYQLPVSLQKPIPYSGSGYNLASPINPAGPMGGGLYGSAVGGGGDNCTGNGQENGGGGRDPNGSGTGSDDYSPYAGRYQLKA